MKFSRRNFISTSLAGLASLSINSRVKAIPNLHNTNTGTIYRTLGKTGIRMPVVGMGVMNADLPALIGESYKIGIRHFDTAWYYQRGKNESMVGEVIDKMGVRKEVIIGTKIYLGRDRHSMPIPERVKLIEERVLESLERLKTNYIDILYYHSAKQVSEIDFPELKDLFLRLKKEGKAKHVGVSTHANQTEIINEVIKQGYFDVVLVAFNYILGKDKELVRTLKKASKKGIGLIAMKTQAGSSLWERISNEKVAGEINHTAMLKWALNNDFITTAVPGYTTFKHMEEDFSVASDLKYSKEEREFLNDIDLDKKLAYCLQCGKCISTCPKNADVPDLMRISMYLNQYHNYFHAYNVYKDIDEKHGLAVCKTCDICTAKCSHYVPIAENIKLLKQMNFC